jgi:hypothetical protein
VTEAIKLAGIDVPGSLEFRKWSINTPRACLGARYGRTAEDCLGRAVVFLRLGEGGVQQ